MIALLAAEDLVAGGLSDLDLILARQFQRGLDRFGAAAGEVDGAAAEVFSGEREQFFGICFGDRGGELAGVNELELCGLRGHGGRNLGHAVSDEVDGCGAGEIEILVAVGVPDVDAFAAHSRGEVFAERSAENGRAGWNGRGVGHN